MRIQHHVGEMHRGGDRVRKEVDDRAHLPADLAVADGVSFRSVNAAWWASGLRTETATSGAAEHVRRSTGALRAALRSAAKGGTS